MLNRITFLLLQWTRRVRKCRSLHLFFQNLDEAAPPFLTEFTLFPFGHHSTLPRPIKSVLALATETIS